MTTLAHKQLHPSSVLCHLFISQLATVLPWSKISLSCPQAPPVHLSASCVNFRLTLTSLPAYSCLTLSFASLLPALLLPAVLPAPVQHFTPGLHWVQIPDHASFPSSIKWLGQAFSCCFDYSSCLMKEYACSKIISTLYTEELKHLEYLLVQSSFFHIELLDHLQLA